MSTSGSPHPERGQVLVFTAIIIALLMGFLALVVDGGIMFTRSDASTRTRWTTAPWRARA